MEKLKTKIDTILRSVNWHILVWMPLVTMLASSCSKEEAVPVSTDYDFVVVDNDYSIPVSIKIVNKTVGADSYKWTFIGADRTSSTGRSPGTLVYDQLGTYIILLEASNADGSKDSKEVEFMLDAAVEVDFATEVLINDFAPATVAITNITKGATWFQWSFDGGDPESSDKEQPDNITFAEPGEHIIKLIVGNGRETHELEKIILVGPSLSVDFDWEVAFEDDDLQVPVTLTLMNKSVGALTYNWGFGNGQPMTSTDENAIVTFMEEGEQTITLTASNGKETQTISKTLEVYANTNLRTFTDVQFGINSAHNLNQIGAFFSTTTREVYTKEQATEINGNLLDIVFFGLGADFSFNKFIAPDEAQNITFEAIPNATHTIFINSQEQCECSTSLSVANFDMMENDSMLDVLDIEETEEGLVHFTDEIVPRIVLFQTADGRKGAIKIKEFIDDGQNSYIVANIKVQKTSI